MQPYNIYQLIIDADVTNIVYLAYPDITNMKVIASHIKTKCKVDIQFHLIIIPYFSVSCKEILEKENVLHRIQYYEIQADLIELTRNTLSMEDEYSFSNLILQKDSYPLAKVERSIQKLEVIFGRIPLKYAKGQWSCGVLDRLLNAEKNSNDDDTPEIHMLVMVDRSLDLVTLLAQQYSFEGCLDEFYGIDGRQIKVESNLIDKAGSAETKKSYNLNDEKSEVFYNELRDKNCNLVSPYFAERLTYLKNIKAESKNKITTEEIKEFTTQIAARNPALELEVLHKLINIWTKAYKSLIDIDESELRESYEKPALSGELEEEESEQLISMFETKLLLYGEDCLVTIMRILCIHCFTYGGLLEKSIERINKAFYYSMGVKGFLIALNLQRANLLFTKGKKKVNWRATKEVYK